MTCPEMGCRWGTRCASIRSDTVQPYIPLWLNPLSLGNSVIYQSGTNIGIGTNSPTYPLTVMTSSSSNGATGVYGTNTSTTGMTYGVQGLVASVSGVGVLGTNTAPGSLPYLARRPTLETARRRVRSDSRKSTFLHRKNWKRHFHILGYPPGGPGDSSRNSSPCWLT